MYIEEEGHAFNLGYGAFFDGELKYSNPFQINETEYEDWLRGWYYAQEEEWNYGEEN